MGTSPSCRARTFLRNRGAKRCNVQVDWEYCICTPRMCEETWVNRIELSKSSNCTTMVVTRREVSRRCGAYVED